jgi:hypothetical protein
MKRQRETDDARIKAARGLGRGVWLLVVVDLVWVNLIHIPRDRQAASSKKSAQSVSMTLDYIVDAVMTRLNGAQLMQASGVYTWAS